MLDRKFIVENAELVKQNCQNRGAKADVDRFVQLEERRKARQIEVEELNRKANEVSKSIGKAKTPPSATPARKRGGSSARRRKPSKPELDAIAAESDSIHRQIPNLSHPDAPVGVDDKANLEVFRGKTPLPKFDFQAARPRRAGREARSDRFRGGANVAGHGFYFLKNDAVLLELALQRYALDVLMSEGFTPMTTPDLARNEVLPGSASFPAGRRRRSTASKTPI